MKIEGTVKPVSGTPSGEPRTKPHAAPQQQPKADQPTVELSALSSSLSKAEAAIAATPVVDQARVDEIRQAISEGRFEIDASRIADGLIASARELLEAGTGRA